VRGTQSFVGVMAAVWRRPSLGGMEMAWRAVAAMGFVWVLSVALGSLGVAVHLTASRHAGAVDWSGLLSLTVFKPVVAVNTIQAVGTAAFKAAWPAVHWLVVEAWVFWLMVAAVGRTFVLRRLDGRLKATPWTVLLLGTLRAVVLVAVWWVWVLGVEWSARVAITGPGAAGTEPNVVGFCGLLICGTLALYVAWGVVSWPLQLAPLLAMRYDIGLGASLVRAFQAGPVRGKLMEINLVMNIVKLALLVLAMVFSASPLPFTSVESPTFLVCWWLGVGVLYMGMSDYFHVVRSASYLRLWRAYENPKVRG
jgi:hypothetical protein